MEEKKPNRRRGRKQTGSRDEGFDTRTQSRRSWENMAVGVVLQLGMLWQRFGFGMQWVSAEPRGYCLNPAGSFLLTDWAVRVWLLLLLISWNSPQNHLFPAIQTAGSDTVVNTVSQILHGVFSKMLFRQINTCLSMSVPKRLYLQTLASLCSVVDNHW